MSPIIRLLLAGLALVAAPSGASAEWTRITSEHFVFIGDAPERDIRAIADRLELFRAAVTRVLSDGVTGSPVPTIVVVFRNDRSFTPFKPQFERKPVAVAGYFIGSDDVNYIAVNAEQDTEAYGVIFHEYTHSLVDHVVGMAPPWIGEGLAQFYQTFQAGRDGAGATLGVPDRQDIGLLQATPLMPIDELIAVDQASPLYNEGRRRTLFYAESWALVHYLTFGVPERAAQLKVYLEAIRMGIPGAEAFQHAFGMDTAALDRDLQRYVLSSTLPAVRVDFGAAIVGARALRGTPIPDHDAAGYLGDLLARLGRIADARAYLQKALVASPQAWRVTGALGLLELQDGNGAAAVSLLERAATLMPDDGMVLSAYGRALVHQAEGGGPEAAARYASARQVLARALELEPGNAPAAVTLAAVEMSQKGDVARAVMLLRRLVQQMPGRENYRLMLARGLAVQGDYPAATTLLGPLMARGSRPEMRDAARELLGQIAAARDGR